MKIVQKLFASFVLALALGVPVCAGEMNSPPTLTPPPPVHCMSQPAEPAPQADCSKPSVSSEQPDTVTMVLSLLLGAITLY
jgi:hypothetical protein